MTHKSKLALIILAAGKGTRMKSDKAKVLHEVFYSPMVHHVLRAVEPLKADAVLAIVGHQREAVIDSLSTFSYVSTVLQEEQLGTGHAVAIAESAIPDHCDTVMVLCGDTPLIRPETLKEMCSLHSSRKSDLTVMTTILENPTNYGRILTDDSGRILGIVEQKDANDSQKAIREINAGIYCVSRTFLFDALRQVDTDNSQGEVYLTDIVAIAVRQGKQVERYVCPYSDDVLGVNSRVELAQAHLELQLRRNHEIMMQGVTLVSPATVSISPDAHVGKDCLIQPGVHLLGTTVVGDNCVIGNGAILSRCTVGNGVTVGPYSVLTDCEIKDNRSIAPYSTED